MKLLPINTKKQRLKIYKLALKEDLTKENSDGLCVILKEISGRTFMNHNLPETIELFPEFNKYVGTWYSILKYKDLHCKNVKQWRIRVLNACIKECLKP